MDEKHCKRINFYGSTLLYQEFSNFARFPIVIDGKVWPTSEHYYQAMKFNTDAEYMEKIRAEKSPAQAKFLASKKGCYPRKIRDDWELIKEDVMIKALCAKFSQHESLKKLLVETGDAILAEHTENDLYWGDGGAKGNGKNRLGILLMEVRNLF